MNTAALYRALDYEYRHPATLHPVEPRQRVAMTGHSCQPDVLERRRRAAQLQGFLGDTVTAASTSAAGAKAAESCDAKSEAGSGSGCVAPPPAPPPSRLSRLAAAVRESRRQPCVEGADLDLALTGQHPLQETARRLLQRVKEDNRLLQLPAGRRAGSSTAAPLAGRSVGGRSVAGRRAHLVSATAGGDERERRKRMFSMLYQ